MKDYELDNLKQLFDVYKKSQMISYGTPDQYQYRQNELIQKIAEIMLIPFYQWEQEQYDKKEKDKELL